MLACTGLAAGLAAYLLYAVVPQEGKTLNAVLFEAMTAGWNATVGSTFVWVTLASEAALLLIAAQAGFLTSLDRFDTYLTQLTGAGR